MAKNPGTGQGMNKEHIKAELRIKFGTMRAFADQLGVDESLIRHTLSRLQPRTERLIAEALGTTAPRYGRSAIPTRYWAINGAGGGISTSSALNLT